MSSFILKRIAAVVFAVVIPAATSCANLPVNVYENTEQVVSLGEIPEYSGSPYIEVDGNIPSFEAEDMTEISFESYAELDYLGRCGEAYANLGIDTMPTEERGNIGMVKPSGWHTAKYDFVDGKYLYNRCHLIGYQLSAENANEQNLITGTRYMNVEGMLPFENEVADYIKTTDNHVLYRVTPIFDGENLVASGVLMEAKSVEDDGSGVSFKVYCYNVQPNVIIDYASGDSWRERTKIAETSTAENAQEAEYVINTKSLKFHRADCASVSDMNSANKREFFGTREQLINEGYLPCKACNP